MAQNSTKDEYVNQHTIILNLKLYGKIKLCNGVHAFFWKNPCTPKNQNSG
jgi:hypothetical protein